MHIEYTVYSRGTQIVYHATTQKKCTREFYGCNFVYGIGHFQSIKTDVFLKTTNTRCVRKVIGQGRNFVTFQSSCLIFQNNIDQTLI